jgi:hypothetical protein
MQHPGDNLRALMLSRHELFENEDDDDYDYETEELT